MHEKSVTHGQGLGIVKRLPSRRNGCMMIGGGGGRTSQEKPGLRRRNVRQEAGGILWPEIAVFNRMQGLEERAWRARNDKAKRRRLVVLCCLTQSSASLGLDAASRMTDTCVRNLCILDLWLTHSMPPCRLKSVKNIEKITKVRRKHSCHFGSLGG